MIAGMRPGSRSVSQPIPSFPCRREPIPQFHRAHNGPILPSRREGDTRLRRNEKLGVALCGAVLALMVCVSPTCAQDTFPAKPVRIILSAGPGGASDIVARIIAERLAAPWKQTVLVENRPGGGAVIATEAVARATPDGYTLGLFGSTLATNRRYATTFDTTPHAICAPSSNLARRPPC